jgi:ArsR family transcriptional regulator, arsenate/arsenite/antimonite-responsive transcriptional repressor
MTEAQAVSALAAVAHGHRLWIFRILVEQGPSGLTAGDLAVRVGIPASNMSVHLKELDHGRLVESTREGRFIRYAVSVEGTRLLLTYLTEKCCRRRPDLCGKLFPVPRSAANGRRRQPIM